MAGPQEIRLAKNQRRRQKARRDQFLRTVAIGQKLIEQGGALDQPGLNLPPLGGVHQQGQRVQLPRALQANRIAMDIESDPLFLNDPARGFVPPPQILRAQTRNRPGKSLIGRAQPALAVNRLVKQPGRTGIILQ